MMTHCIVNGESTAIGGDAITIAALLQQLGLSGRKIAVEKNGVIISKSRHGEECIHNGDKLEVITAVGGG